MTIYEEPRSDWSHQVSGVATTRRLEHDQTLPSAKGCLVRLGGVETFVTRINIDQSLV